MIFEVLYFGIYLLYYFTLLFYYLTDYFTWSLSMKWLWMILEMLLAMSEAPNLRPSNEFVL
jgi:sensor histidine kinase YesM